MNDVKVGMIQIDGLRELELRLSALPVKMERNILVQAIGAGARVIKKQAIENAPSSVEPHILRSYASAVFKTYKTKRTGVWILPGNLKRMIRVKVDSSKSRGYAVTYEVYVKNKEAWYWRFVEFGTSKNPKPKGFGFMRNAFESMKFAAIKEIEEQIKLRLESEGVSI